MNYFRLHGYRALSWVISYKLPGLKAAKNSEQTLTFSHDINAYVHVGRRQRGVVQNIWTLLQLSFCKAEIKMWTICEKATERPIGYTMTLTAAVHVGHCILLAPDSAGSRLAAPRSGLHSSGCRTDVVRGVSASQGRRTTPRKAVFTSSPPIKVDTFKYAVRIRNSSRLRWWRRLTRGAKNILRAKESALEMQVSIVIWHVEVVLVFRW